MKLSDIVSTNEETCTLVRRKSWPNKAFFVKIDGKTFRTSFGETFTVSVDDLVADDWNVVSSTYNEQRDLINRLHIAESAARLIDVIDAKAIPGVSEEIIDLIKRLEENCF